MSNLFIVVASQNLRMTPSRRLLLVSLLSVVRSEELTLRLSGGKFTEAGYVQVWRGGRWGVRRKGDGAAMGRGGLSRYFSLWGWGGGLLGLGLASP